MKVIIVRRGEQSETVSGVEEVTVDEKGDTIIQLLRDFRVLKKGSFSLLTVSPE